MCYELKGPGDLGDSPGYPLDDMVLAASSSSEREVALADLMDSTSKKCQLLNDQKAEPEWIHEHPYYKVFHPSRYPGRAAE